mgnify:CR=1 FL=1
MIIRLKREAKAFLNTHKDEIDQLIIDGSLDADYIKSCGCCGPPPSPDYAVKIIKESETNKSIKSDGKYVEVENIVKFKVSKQLFDAAKTARMNFVIFYMESTSDLEGSGILVAKII